MFTAAHHLLKITIPSAPRKKKKFQVLPQQAKANSEQQLLPKVLASTNLSRMREPHPEQQQKHRQLLRPPKLSFWNARSE